MAPKRFPFFFLFSLLLHLSLLAFLVLWTRGWFSKLPLGRGVGSSMLLVNLGGGSQSGSGEVGNEGSEKKKEEEKKTIKTETPPKKEKSPILKKEALFQEKKPEKAVSSIPSQTSKEENIPGTGADTGEGGTKSAGGTAGLDTTGTGGGGEGKGTASILAEIRRKIERAKHYPPLASLRHIEGVAILSFRIEENGGVSGLRLVGSSGSSLLDEEALATVRRAVPLPYYPKPIQVPLEFSLDEN